jgi:hypothetical protein
VSNFTIEKRVTVIKEDDPDLEVERAAFLSSVPRDIVDEVQKSKEILLPKSSIKDLFEKSREKKAPFNSSEDRF